MTLTTAEALGTYFPLVLNGETVKVKGLHMPDGQLEKYGKLDKHPVVVPAALADLAPVARQLLAETVATSDQDESGKPRTVRVPAPPPTLEITHNPDGTSEYDLVQDPHPGEVLSPTSHPTLTVRPGGAQATKPTPEDTPGWAVRLESKIDKVLNSLAYMTQEPKTYTAPGIGQGGAAGQESDGVFTTETIEAKKEKGKLSFKVKGGGFKKFGVLVWPEVLEAAGLRPDSFPIGDEVPFAGYSAHYILGDPNESGKQFPRKITRLVRH